MWIALGPGSLRIRSLTVPLPWPLASWPAAQGGRFGSGRYGWFFGTLDVIFDPFAGVDRPLSFREGSYIGPGFSLVRVGSQRYTASVADSTSVAGALAALLIDASSTFPFLLLHAGAWLWQGRAVLLLGPSGSGKSTCIERLSKRAIGSNVVISWVPSPGRGWHVAALPLTGHADAAVRPGIYSVRCALALSPTISSQNRIALSLAEQMAYVVASIASARGTLPRLDLAAQFVRECPVYKRNLNVTDPCLAVDVELE